MANGVKLSARLLGPDRKPLAHGGLRIVDGKLWLELPAEAVVDGKVLISFTGEQAIQNAAELDKWGRYLLGQDAPKVTL